MRPESEPTMRKSRVAPVRRKGASERMQANISTVYTVCRRPLSSGRSSSSVLPRDTMISCALGAEKLPYTAHCQRRGPRQCCPAALPPHVALSAIIVRRGLRVTWMPDALLSVRW